MRGRGTRQFLLRGTEGGRSEQRPAEASGLTEAGEEAWWTPGRRGRKCSGPQAEVQRPTGGSAAAHRRKCAECPRTATEAVWLSRERRRKRRP